MAPATGYFPDSSAKIRHTQNWHTNTIGQVQKNAGPPRLKPSGKNAKTVVRIETKEKPDAKAAYPPIPRCNSWVYPSSSSVAASSWDEIAGSKVAVIVAPHGIRMCSSAKLVRLPTANVSWALRACKRATQR